MSNELQEQTASRSLVNGSSDHGQASQLSGWQARPGFGSHSLVPESNFLLHKGLFSDRDEPWSLLQQLRSKVALFALPLSVGVSSYGWRSNTFVQPLRLSWYLNGRHSPLVLSWWIKSLLIIPYCHSVEWAAVFLNSLVEEFIISGQVPW